MNLVILEAGEIGAAGDVSLDGVRGRHLLQVLNVGPGQQVRVGVLDGPHGVATVTSVAAATVALRCAFETEIPPRPRVDLLLALPRPKVMRRLWAQIAALGVGQIILTNAERVERNYFDTHVLTEDGLLVNFATGSRHRLPCHSPSVQGAVEDELTRSYRGLRLLADPAAATPLATVVRDSRERILLAIGPEGGWNGFETALLEAHGFQTVGMGPRTLRSDTACIALIALVSGHLLESLGELD